MSRSSEHDEQGDDTASHGIELSAVAGTGQSGSGRGKGQRASRLGTGARGEGQASWAQGEARASRRHSCRHILSAAQLLGDHSWLMAVIRALIEDSPARLGGGLAGRAANEAGLEESLEAGPES